MVVRPAERSSNQEARSAADIEYFADAMRLWSQAMVDTAVRVELGKRALATPHPISEDAQQANQRRRVAVDDWPDAALKIAAVDVADGHVRFFDRSQHVPFITALAATTAQPGLQAPITVDGHRYMDGGVAGTNLDGAVGYEIVVGITPFGARDKTSWEMEQVRAAGGRVLDITADDEARRAMGPITSGRTKDAAAAGLRQAAAMSSAVRELWLGQS
jgi:NTE family protein